MYIFGYWSIINKANSELTTEVWDTIPVIVEWLERHWNITSTQWYTVLWIKRSVWNKVNGVLIELKWDIKDFDERETKYTRIKLESRNIHTIDTSISKPTDDIFAYIPNEENYINWEHPILQSYIDVVLSWCINISDEFAYDFIKSTQGWWEIKNDRDDPEYVRSMNLKEYHDRIDSLLRAITA